MKYISYLVILFLTGCVMPTEPTIKYVPPLDEASAKAATICIYRTSNFLSGATDIDIYIDGTLAAELGNGDSVSVKVSPGKHEIKPSGWRGDGYFPVIYYRALAPSINHQFLPGMIYYIRWHYPSFFQSGTWKTNPEVMAPNSRFRLIEPKDTPYFNSGALCQ